MGDLQVLFPGLTETDLACLQACSIVDSGGRATTLADLASGWAAHVARFEREATLSWDDPTAWAEDDFVGALHLRDRLALALEQAPARERELVERVLPEIDRRFEQLTKPDTSQLLARVLPGEALRAAWWWSRIPTKGPVLEGLLRLRG